MTERDDTPYREGVVMEVPRKEGKGALADVGLKSYVQLDKSIQPRVRVTVKMVKASGNILYNYKKVILRQHYIYVYIFLSTFFKQRRNNLTS